MPAISADCEWGLPAPLALLPGVFHGFACALRSVPVGQKKRGLMPSFLF